MSKKVEVEWQEQQLNMKECVRRIYKKLPRLVIVRIGEETYWGEDEGYNFQVNEVFCLTHCVKLERMIAEDEDKKKVSIPVNYPVQFHMVRENGTYDDPASLSFLIDRLDPGDELMAVESEELGIGKLTFISSYHERFFIGNNILEGEPYEGVIAVPFHTDIKVSLASGLREGTLEDFKKHMEDLKMKTTKFKNERKAEVCAEIELFKEDNVNIEDYVDYDYIKPHGYHRVAQKQQVLPPRLVDSPLYFHPDIAKPEVPPKCRTLDPTKRGKLPAPPPGELTGRRAPRNDVTRPVTISPENDRQESQDVYSSPDEINASYVKVEHQIRSNHSSPDEINASCVKLEHQQSSPATKNQSEQISIAVTKVLGQCAEVGKGIGKGIGKKIKQVLPLPQKNQGNISIQHCTNKEQLEPGGSSFDAVAASQEFTARQDENKAKRLSNPYKTPHNPPRPVSALLDGTSNTLQRGRDRPPEPAPRNIKTQRPNVRPPPQLPSEVTENTLTGSTAVKPPPKLSSNVKTEETHQESVDEESSPYVTFSDVPKNLGNATVSEVAACLKLLHLTRYVDSFEEHQIDGAMMLSLTQEILVEEFGMTKFDAMKLEKFFKTQWRPKLT